MGSLYNRVKVNNPGHSFFNLSHDKKFDCDAGQLIPIDVQFCMPNDVIKFGNEIVSRMNPLVAPMMHEVNVYTQYFFVPLRIMFGQMKSHTYPGASGTETVSEWDVNDRDFETFLIGGKTGYDTSVSLPMYDWTTTTSSYNDCYSHRIAVNPDSTGDDDKIFNCVFIPSGTELTRGFTYIALDASDNMSYRSCYVDGQLSTEDLWQPLYMNELTYQTGVYSLWDYLGLPVGVYDPTFQVSAFPFRAYNLIYNNFFRDQNLMDELDVINSKAVKNVCWNKDYFTAAYTELQRGQSPALPLSESLLPVFFDVNNNAVSSQSFVKFSNGKLGSSNNVLSLFDYDGASISGVTPYVGSVDASGLFNVNDLRLAIKVQEWLETNMRVGNHLNEFLIGHFGIGPHDETLQRPVYLGGSKSPVIVSEVLQTSSTDSTSPQGNMAGHGITADRNYIGSYRCKEFGIFMGVMYIRPKATYQQGVNRAWQYQTKYDFPFPEFAHLGNQAIFESEIFMRSGQNYDANGNPVVFGYTERYNELRSAHSEVCGGLRSLFDFWHLGRIFDDAPNLNADFVRCVPDKRVFAVQTEPGFICNVGNILHAYRPIPTYGDPRT